MYDQFNCATYEGQASASNGQEWQEGVRGDHLQHIQLKREWVQAERKSSYLKSGTAVLQYYSLTTFCTIERNQPVFQL
jgi:hypothetical protein